MKLFKPNTDIFHTISQSAKLLGLTPQEVERLVKRGDLKSTVGEYGIRIAHDDLTDYMMATSPRPTSPGSSAVRWGWPQSKSKKKR